MLSYPIDEAEELLDTKLKAAKLSLSNCEEDMDFLREQITVLLSQTLDRRLRISLTMDRLWRWRSLGSTTGMLCISARRRRKRRSTKKRAPRPHESESLEPDAGRSGAAPEPNSRRRTTSRILRGPWPLARGISGTDSRCYAIRNIKRCPLRRVAAWY